MSITVDEFLRLKNICEPRNAEFPAPLTEELINEAAGHLRPYMLSRLEAAKNVPPNDWPALIFPRTAASCSITPDGVAHALHHAYWRLECWVRALAKEKHAVEPIPARITAEGMVLCPWCGKLLAVQKEQDSEQDV